MTTFIDVHGDENVGTPSHPIAINATPFMADEDRFPALAELLDDLLTPQMELGADPLKPDHQFGMYVERLHLELPLEIQSVRDSNNVMGFGATLPTQWIETSVQPVLHRLRITLELDDADDSGNETLES